jgi:hypothetical protein
MTQALLGKLEGRYAGAEQARRDKCEGEYTKLIIVVLDDGGEFQGLLDVLLSDLRHSRRLRSYKFLRGQ